MNSDEEFDQEEAAAQKLPFELYPEKSRNRYNATYKAFKSWCSEKKNNCINEEVLLEYFKERCGTLKSPMSFLCEYSMLKTTICINDSKDISKYTELRNFLGQKNINYQPKESKVFTSEEVNSFLTNAPDDTYLMLKVVTVLGIQGACRADELIKIRNENIEEKEDLVIVHIPNSKVPRTFTVIENKQHEVDFLQIVKKYISIKNNSPNLTNTKDAKFFVRYEKGKCRNQPVGKNKFNQMPSIIATFLNLPNPKLFRGNAFRQTATTLLANKGVDVHNTGSIHQKRQKLKTAKNISNSGAAATSTSTISSTPEFKEVVMFDDNASKSTTTPTFDQIHDEKNIIICNTVSEICDNKTNDESDKSKFIKITNCTNCTFTFVNK